MKTERLALRPVTPDDWRELQAAASGYMAGPYGKYDHQWPLDEAGIQAACQWLAASGDYTAVCRRSDGQFLGFVCLNPAGESVFDLGYLFGEEYHGQCYATEACRALMGQAFRERGALRITSGTAAANEPSRRLLARLGFHVTGTATASFCNDEQGRPIEFEGHGYEFTREKWETSHRD